MTSLPTIAPSATPIESLPTRGAEAPILFVLRMMAVLLLLFALMRLLLIVRNWTAGLATAGDIARSFLVGARFDLATAAYVIVPMSVIAFIPWISPARSPKSRRWFVMCWTLVLTGIIFILLAELEFFHEFQSRFNQLAFRYLDHPKIVAGMLWYTYPVVRYVLGAFVLGVGVYFAMRWAVNRSFAPVRVRFRPTIYTEIASAGLIVLALVIAARGGLQGEPLRWGRAFHGKNEFANQMSLNGLYSLAVAGRDDMRRARNTGEWGGVATQSHRAEVRRMLVAADEQLLDPELRTVLRQRQPGSQKPLLAAAGQKPNVVVVMMESFSARYVGSCGAPKTITPHFDALAADGVLFDRCLSAGSHTHQGIFATQMGFPNLPAHEQLMDETVANQPFLTFSRIYAEQGYSTHFLYNGDLAWDNMRGFFGKQGVEHFVGGDAMLAEAKFRDPVWGVSDGDLFDRANREFDAAARKGPFMAAIMTLSNHAPFEVPPVPNTSPITGYGEDDRRLEALRYSDYAIGQFIESAKKLDYFKNTLFVFVGDHGFHVSPVLTDVHLLYHHVPLLFYAPGLGLKPRVDHRVAAQMNVLPSVQHLIGMDDRPHAAWARSLFDDSFKDDGFAVFKMSTGTTAVGLARGDTLLVLGSPSGKPQFVRYSLGFPPSIEPINDPEARRTMERELRSYVTCALDDLLQSRAGSAKP